jgi:hypothetical protein
VLDIQPPKLFVEKVNPISLLALTQYVEVVHLSDMGHDAEVYDWDWLGGLRGVDVVACSTSRCVRPDHIELIQYAYQN